MAAVASSVSVWTFVTGSPTYKSQHGHPEEKKTKTKETKEKRRKEKEEISLKNKEGE